MSERFNELPPTPVDAIMQANAAWEGFLKIHPTAINTTIGIMVDPQLKQPWQPVSVQQARRKAQDLSLKAGNFGYQGPTGYGDFLSTAGKNVFGTHTYVRHADSMLAYQTVGGTNTLFVAKEIAAALVKQGSDGRIPVALDSGWTNHTAIFEEPFRVTDYVHADPENGKYNHQAALDALSAVPDGSIFLLQTCGYNDDGAERSRQEWDEVLSVAESKQAVVILDSAYMGLVEGFESDRYAIEQSLKRELLTFVCFSASKNMGLYNERLGALYIANADKHLSADQFPRLKQLTSRVVRRTISNPPLVVARAAAIALKLPEYKQELTDARDRLNANRAMFAEQVKSELPHIADGRGLFTKLLPGGFTSEQQALLVEKSIYALGNSRINLGGLHSDQVERVGEAVMQALKLR